MLPDMISYDALDYSLAALHPRGAFLYRSELSGTWGLSVAQGRASFHAVESGTCLIEVDGAASRLDAGDLLVLPHGSAATFRSHADAPALPIDELVARHPLGPDQVLRFGTGGKVTHLVCGELDFDDAVPHPILSALPSLVIARRADDASPWLSQTLSFLSCEARSDRPGSTTVMGHLGSILLVHAIRSFVESPVCSDAEPAPANWLSALGDVHVGPALRAILTAPEHRWTVENLGREAGLGRSAFASRFRDRVGETPMQHVTRWRIYHASRLLRSDLGLAEIAERVGYENEAAFGRAFKRWTGVTPGAMRRVA